MALRIHPSVGVARLGNSPEQFYLAPEKTGQLPFEADPFGNKGEPVHQFKDYAGRVRRQGQAFKLLSEDGTELTLDNPNVQSIQWTVHLANKKAAWYQYSELQGNLLYGQENSYQQQKVPFRNPDQTTEQDRQKLIIDPGPRSLAGRRQSIGFDKDNAPLGYPVSYPPGIVTYGTAITTLGDLLTDDLGRLIVLGGYGNAGGDKALTSYGGSDTWHDDISDGPVYCTVTYQDGSSEQLSAWVVVGSPDFAPEIVNISTLSDTMFDVGVRFYNLVPEIYSNGQFNPDFRANYQRDIEPLVERLSRYQWVANVQAMSAFNSRQFDYADNSDANKANRQQYFSYFRGLNKEGDPSADQPQQVLFKDNFPMLPLNSGSNSVSNELIMKFLALNETQQFLLSQWAVGRFDSNHDAAPYPVNPLDQGSVGNCVGLPMCPGIEVTWSMQNPAVYAAPYRIADEKGPNGYNSTGLTPSRDECEGGGCQPGDLTKRMACPWQADFFQCTVQTVNFTVPEVNKANGAPLPPTYYAYWWPPQSPWDVLTGETTVEGQAASHLPAGQQMNYARGINSFVQMVEHWSALAFIRDNNSQAEGYPYFTETERNNEIFAYKEVGVGAITGNPDDNETTIPVFYIEADTQQVKTKSARAVQMVKALEQRAFKAIEVASGGLGTPRSGTRMRR
ncbi:MAG: CTQ-dependent lysine 6-oxidase LodA [Gammaproteobacteria bacterium]|nr:CTQ-dependent lysine 6-oxidase LodA [Gammaproteobacteria bacterium]MBU2059595.1 CTQ-dependent lysine 6-oxidase LodA [Gammaproteobacteria bacterium]MBU2175753.1 CTQ-dependent lysine 6-oxidase LodA [Gammaproteobacteria bacterium]MBU2248067.1 CTQ-dependent lysine 6-oxidase LodA [Gammaproteobacteria bacterium]MBU2345988.1 CTQ-dependent lysine 6-oxidase LodA [Gammaproteobacteria bacterium]